MPQQLDFCAMLFLSSVKIVRFVLATVLSLWVAGAGCMLGCEGMIAAAATDPSANASQHVNASQELHGSTIVASGHACSSGEGNRTHNCCKKKSSEAQSKSEPASSPGTRAAALNAGSSSSEMMNDCPFAVRRAAIVNKVRNGEVSSAPAPTHSILLSDISSEQMVPLSAPARIPNRGHTYLRCCVFLI
jgi:hypothetical protein